MSSSASDQAFEVLRRALKALQFFNSDWDRIAEKASPLRRAFDKQAAGLNRDRLHADGNFSIKLMMDSGSTNGNVLWTAIADPFMQTYASLSMYKQGVGSFTVNPKVAGLIFEAMEGCVFSAKGSVQYVRDALGPFPKRPRGGIPTSTQDKSFLTRQYNVGQVIDVVELVVLPELEALIPQIAKEAGIEDWKAHVQDMHQAKIRSDYPGSAHIGRAEAA